MNTLHSNMSKHASTALNHRAVMNESGKVTWQNKSMWIIVTVGFAFNYGLGFIFPGLGIDLFIRAVLGLVVIAFMNGSLISMANAALEKQPVNIRSGFQAGLHWLLPVFAIHVLFTIPSWIISLLGTGSLAAAYFIGATQAGVAKNSVDSHNLTFALALLVSLFCSAISVGAERALILDRMPLLQSVKHGWQLLRSKLRDYFVLGLLLLLILFAAGVIEWLASMIFNFLLGGTNTATSFQLVLAIAITAMLSAVSTNVWTIAYRQWHTQANAAELLAISTRSS